MNVTTVDVDYMFMQWQMLPLLIMIVCLYKTNVITIHIDQHHLHFVDRIWFGMNVTSTVAPTKHFSFVFAHLYTVLSFFVWFGLVWGFEEVSFVCIFGYYWRMALVTFIYTLTSLFFHIFHREVAMFSSLTNYSLCIMNEFWFVNSLVALPLVGYLDSVLISVTPSWVEFAVPREECFV